MLRASTASSTANSGSHSLRIEGASTPYWRSWMVRQLQQSGCLRESDRRSRACGEAPSGSSKAFIEAKHAERHPCADDAERAILPELEQIIWSYAKARATYGLVMKELKLRIKKHFRLIFPGFLFQPCIFLIGLREEV